MPIQITIYQAAASPSALVFMLTFIGVLIPIVLFYNIYNYPSAPPRFLSG